MKTNQRTAKRTLFLSAEGNDEKVFVDYLVKLYSRGNMSPRIRDAEGGCPRDIVEHCVRRTVNGGFDYKVVFMDLDADWGEETTALIRKHQIIPIGSNPCLEAMLLAILDPNGKKFSKTESKKCKKYFQDNHLQKRKGLRDKDCSTLFPLKLLETRRKEIYELDLLINLLEGNYKVDS